MTIALHDKYRVTYINTDCNAIARIGRLRNLRDCSIVVTVIVHVAFGHSVQRWNWQTDRRHGHWWLLVGQLSWCDYASRSFLVKPIVLLHSMIGYCYWRHDVRRAVSPWVVSVRLSVCKTVMPCASSLANSYLAKKGHFFYQCVDCPSHAACQCATCWKQHLLVLYVHYTFAQYCLFVLLLLHLCQWQTFRKLCKYASTLFPINLPISKANSHSDCLSVAAAEVHSSRTSSFTVLQTTQDVAVQTISSGCGPGNKSCNLFVKPSTVPAVVACALMASCVVLSNSWNSAKWSPSSALGINSKSEWSGVDRYTVSVYKRWIVPWLCSAGEKLAYGSQTLCRLQ